MARSLAAGALAVLVLVLVLAGGGGDGHEHEVTVTVPSATGVIAGQSIRAGGSRVGKVLEVGTVSGGRGARLRLGIDDAAWPMPAGSSMHVRWGGTVRIEDRYIELRRGTGDGPAMVGDGGRFPASAFVVPVELDQLLAAFTPKLRRDARAMLRRGGLSLDAASPLLRRSLDVAPPALTQADAVLGDLDADERALTTLVASTGSVVDAIDTANPRLDELLAGAGTTLDTVAGEARSLQDVLDRAPQTFRRVRTTLRRADPTLDAARELTTRLGPGVTEVRRIAAPLNGTLGTLRDIGPAARATLRTARTGAPDLTSLLRRATGLMPQFLSIGEQADEQLECIRPYTPDIVAFGTNWSGILSGTDGEDKYIRANVQNLVPAPNNADNRHSADIKQLYPGLDYAFPRPPGHNAGQPWFLPQCGVGPEALDPSKDPEADPITVIGAMPPLAPLARRPKGGR